MSRYVDMRRVGGPGDQWAVTGDPSQANCRGLAGLADRQAASRVRDRYARQPVTTDTSPMSSARTGSSICAASPTRTVTSRSPGKALTTAAVASTVPVSASRAYRCAW